jgi:hypothetical protein
MPPIARSFAAVIAGMVVAVTVVSIFDRGAGLLHPVPAGFDVTDMAQVNAHASSAPTGALLLVLTGWILGPFAGGLVASRIAIHSRRLYAWVILALLLSATIANLIAIPHPAWMVAAALLGVPWAGWMAARLAPPDVSVSR